MNPQIINLAYIVSAAIFILGIKMLGKPETARKGNLLSSVGMLIAVVFVCAVRYFSVDKESFYKTALSAMAAWIVCEAFAAIGFKNDLMSVIGLVTFAAEMAWYILCALAGAWATHAVMRGFKRPIAKGRGENESR